MLALHLLGHHVLSTSIWYGSYDVALPDSDGLVELLAGGFGVHSRFSISADYTYDDIIAAFRREAKKVHAAARPSSLRKLVEARDRLLAALPASAPTPKMPTYARKDVQTVG